MNVFFIHYFTSSMHVLHNIDVSFEFRDHVVILIASYNLAQSAEMTMGAEMQATVMEDVLSALHPSTNPIKLFAMKNLCASWG